MRRLLKLSLSMILFCLGFSVLEAQNEKDRWDGPIDISSDYLIQNANIQVSPTEKKEGYDIWVSEGKIKKISKGIIAPLAVERIDGDSMMIYAGFIDGLSNAGIKKPEKTDEKPNRKGNPPNHLAGITPENSAGEMYHSGEKTVKNLRSKGVTLGHVVPRGRMLPGQGSIILFGEESAEKSVLKKDISCYSQLRGSGGMYPATVIGVMAKWRELYRDASNAMAHQGSFEMNSGAYSRPQYSKAITGLYPVVNKKQKVFFNTEKALSAYRATELQKELGFNLVLANVSQTWLYSDRLKKLQAPIILSMELPKEEKEKLDSTALAELNTEELAFHNRNVSEREKHLTQAGNLAKMGKKFAFSSLDLEASDYKKNLVRMVENGLSEKDALEALTTYPAQLFGVSSWVGTVTEGKLANLVMTDGSYFDKESKIKMVFVEGKKFDVEKPKKDGEKTDDALLVQVVGEWKWNVEMMGESITGTFKIWEQDGVLEGEMSSVMDDETTDLQDLTYDGETLKFLYSDGQIEATMSLDVDGESAVGTASVAGMGQGKFSADRTSKPE